jgi:hypothetical protein
VRNVNEGQSAGRRGELPVDSERERSDELKTRLECLLFSGYDPYFEGDEPPGL